ncbi:uncharacterized protein CDAR_98191 [Caerostris darwini]|uniref:HNH homing endonuclease n=1 Tax=Caerostris darwini TaxID=1538125 RepID=A0AAV4UFR2_9ARAC|nr:uncharacterized protein CDAR_98191 [Caerostris darwini]
MQIMDDFNSKVDDEVEFRSVIGKYSFMSTNDNSNRLINFVVSHDMVIDSTMFQHRDIHKIAWRSTDGSHNNQINHMLIDSRHFTKHLDVRTYRRTNINFNYYLMIRKFREMISLESKVKKICSVRFKRRKLKDPRIREKYQMNIKKK